MTHRKILAALAAVALTAPPARAEDPAPPADEVFLSLTRSAEPAARMPTNVSVVTAEELRRAGAVTLADALEMLPSVQALKAAVPGQFSSVRLRGTPSANHTQVVVDDQPLGGVFLQDLDIGQIPVDNIDRIEVVRGGASILYGANTLGGVVHVITKKAHGGKALSSVSYEARSFGTQVQSAEIRAPGRKSDVYLNASTYRTEGFQRNSDGDGLSVTGGAGLSLENGARFSLDASRVDTESGDPQGTTVPLALWNGEREKAPVNALSRVAQETTLVRGRAVVPVGAATVQTLFYGSNQDYLNDDPVNFVLSELDKNVLGNDTRLQFPGRWTVGAAYERDEYRSKGTAKLHGTSWGVYLQKSLTLGAVDLLPALRFDQHGTFGNAYNPRLTVVWRVSERVKASANAGRSFRSPTLVDLKQDFPVFSFYANRDLRPETAWSYDAGVSLPAGGRSTLSVTAFHTRLRERIVSTGNPWPAANTLINAPRAETSGLETELSGRWGPVVHRLGHTYQRARGNGLSSSRYAPLRRTPRQQLRARLTWEAPRGWSLTGGAEYVSRQFENDNERGLLMPGRTLWDARIARTILSAELYLAGENLTNRRYADAFGFGVLVPQPGRTFWGGMRIRFRD